MAVELDRAAVLAHRVWAQGLHGSASVGDLDVLGVGLQDTPAGSAALGLRQRTGYHGLDRPELALALTVRGYRTCTGGPTCRCSVPRCGRGTTTCCGPTSAASATS